MNRREVTVHAETWTDVFRLRPDDVEALMRQARETHRPDQLASLHRQTPRELSLDLFTAEDGDAGVFSLFLGDHRVATLRR